MQVRTFAFSSFVAACAASLAIGACGSSDPAPPDKAQQEERPSTGAGGSSSTGAGGSLASGGSSATGEGGSDGTAAGGTDSTGTGGTGTGGTGTGAVKYPLGPYGNNEGTILSDDSFDGLMNPETAGYVSQGKTTKISFHDFYNPTADPSRPRMLVVLIAARWCGPCQMEAAAARKDNQYWTDKGVLFFSTMYQNEMQEPAEYVDLDAWTKTYKLNFPSVLDPASKLGKYFTTAAFPNNMIIDLTTMKILYAQTGGLDFGPDNALLKQYAVK